MALNFQDMIRELQAYWAARDCVVMQPYHTELGAGTFNPATFLRCLGPEPWRTVYVEPCIRPTDGRYGENPYRFQQYYQLQVILKPAPEDILDQYFGSLEAIGIDTAQARRPPRRGRLGGPDARRVGPRLGGLVSTAWRSRSSRTSSSSAGWTSRSSPARSRTALERLAMFLQDKSTAFDLEWAPGFTWGDVYRENERQFSAYNFEEASVELLMRHFADARGRVRAAPRARAAAAGVRPGAQGLAHLQPAGRARRDLRDRARLLHRPGARPRPAGRPGVRWRSCCCLRSAARSFPPPPSTRRRRSCPSSASATSAPRRTRCSSGRGGSRSSSASRSRRGEQWIKGPPVSLREKAAEGFAKRHGVSVDDLEERDGFLGVVSEGQSLGQALPGQLDGDRPRPPLRQDDALGRLRAAVPAADALDLRPARRGPRRGSRDDDAGASVHPRRGGGAERRRVRGDASRRPGSSPIRRSASG